MRRKNLPERRTEPSEERPSEIPSIVLLVVERKGEHDRQGGAVSMMQSTGERWVHGVSVVYQADDAARNVQNGGHCVGAGNANDIQCNIF